MIVDLQSKILKSFEYRFTTQTLAVTRSDGRIQIFDGVPQAVIKELILAPSHGKYFLDNIRESFPLTVVGVNSPAQ